jgi:uncharacterized FAD-dependent dehydrogenase
VAQSIQIQVLPHEIEDVILKQKIASLIKIPLNEIEKIHLEKKSIDARQKLIKFNLTLKVFFKGENIVLPFFELPDYQNVANNQEVVIIGAGPAGLFAALQLIEKGLKPIVLERGKDVKSRRRDLKAINIDQKVNSESNYCFGEGGAGTYSDGKLYTRSKKRGDVQRILQLLVAFGASQEILVDAHPHIGTNKLPQIIEKIRNTIIDFGGEVLFDTKVVDFLIDNNQIKGIVTQKNQTIKTNHVILATGHSARDIYELLERKNILQEIKPFALGVRAEHPQSYIDQIQYKCDIRNPLLPSAPYSIVKQVNNRGVYSFCMCPGGVIAPCATSESEVVTNGWSPSKRDQPWANSGIVIELKLEDFLPFKKFGVLAALEFQKSIEQNAWQLAGKTQKVPAQRLDDFVNKKQSINIPKTSYIPGTTSIQMDEVFPNFITDTLRNGFKAFNQSMKGYINPDAILHAPESRTSSPIRISRNPETLEHTQIKGLYPCGEGAGYAGGIISAAIDGEKCALAIHEKIVK